MGRTRIVDAIGEVASITYPAYDAHSYIDVIVSLGDSGGVPRDNLLLRFLGRRTLECIDTGSRVHVQGTRSSINGTPVVFNPKITVIAESQLW